MSDDKKAGGDHAAKPPPIKPEEVKVTVVPQEGKPSVDKVTDQATKDVRKAVKLEPTTYPVWKATISLPVNASYTYQFYIRNDAAGQGGNAGNGTPIGSVLNGSTISTIPDPASKTAGYSWGSELAAY